MEIKMEAIRGTGIDYAEQMRELLAPLDECGVRELASHGHPNAPQWAINDWLETYSKVITKNASNPDLVMIR
jgi:hypothetical protein